jgi:ribosomal protein S27AE
MQTCPHCSTEIILRELPHQGLFENFRICPKCGGSFTADSDTKLRQAMFIIIALVSLAFTVFLYFGSGKWLVPALASYVVLGLLVFWGNRKMFLVPYKKGQGPTNDT